MALKPLCSLFWNISMNFSPSISSLPTVQFVPFRDYIDRRGNHILSMARLAKEVLAEIPDQFLSYMRTRGIKPGPLPPPYTPCPPPAVHPLLTRRVSRIWRPGCSRWPPANLCCRTFGNVWPRQVMWMTLSWDASRFLRRGWGWGTLRSDWKSPNWEAQKHRLILRFTEITSI